MKSIHENIFFKYYHSNYWESFIFTQSFSQLRSPQITVRQAAPLESASGKSLVLLPDSRLKSGFAFLVSRFPHRCVFSAGCKPSHPTFDGKPRLVSPSFFPLCCPQLVKQKDYHILTALHKGQLSFWKKKV